MHELQKEHPWSDSGVRRPSSADLIDVRASETQTKPGTTPSRSHAAYRRISLGLALTDSASVVLALLVAYIFRFGMTPIPADYLIPMMIAPLVWLGAGGSHQLYRPWRLAPVDEFRRIIGVGGIATVIMIMTSYWGKTSLSRQWIALTFFLSLALILITRRAWRWHIARSHARGKLLMRALVLGTNLEASLVAQELNNPTSGFEPIGFIRLRVEDDRDLVPVDVVGEIAELERTIRDGGVEALFVASTASNANEMFEIIQIARHTGTSLHVSATLPELLAHRLTVHPIGGLTTLSVSTARLSGIQSVTKRGFDLSLTIIGLIPALPLMALTALAIRVTSKGPALFRQTRVTRDGRLFEMYKFRTMYEEADSILEGQDIDLSTPYFKLGEDPRLTKVGRFIRKLSIDELPQLLNVLKGEMSLVGPRPLPANQVAAHPELLGPRHEVPAGMTGWWQVKGRSELGHEEAIRMDRFYIENWSPALDVYILLKTIGAVLARRGAA